LDLTALPVAEIHKCFCISRAHTNTFVRSPISNRKLNECRRVIIQLPLIESHSNPRIFSMSPAKQHKQQHK